MKKKVLSILLVFAMVLSLIPATAFAGEDQIVISENTTWNDDTLTKDLVIEEGVVLTLEKQLNISGDVKISGGGTIKSTDAINASTPSLVYVPEGSTLTIENITIDGGASFGTSTDNEADTLYVDIMGHNLTNTGVKRTGDGSLIWVEKGTLYLKSGTILQNNDAECCGGAVRDNSGIVYIEPGVTIQDIKCKTGAVANIKGKLYMTGGLVKGCYANDYHNNAGGGLRIQGYSEISDAEICNNYALPFGGGVSVTWEESKGTIIDNCKIHHNYAPKGAGIFCQGDTTFTTVSECEIYNNIARDTAAGFACNDVGYTAFINTSIHDNIAPYASALGGGLYITLENCDITGNINTDDSLNKGAVYSPLIGSSIEIKGNTVIKDNKVRGETDKIADIQCTFCPEKLYIGGSFDGLIKGIALSDGSNQGVRFNYGNKSPTTIVKSSNGHKILKSELDRLEFEADFYEKSDTKYQLVCKDNIGYRVPEVKITFHSNNGSDETATQTVLASIGTQLDANSFSKEGSTFLGWSDNESNLTTNGVKYVDQDGIIASTNDIDLYAIWDSQKTAYIPNTSIEAQEFVYDGTAKSFVLDTADQGVTVSYKKGGKAVTYPLDSGEYDVILHKDEENNQLVYNLCIYGGLVIKPAEITIKADDKNGRLCDASIPELTVSADSRTGFTGELSAACKADGTKAGTFAIVPNKVTADDNHTIKYVNGTLTLQDHQWAEIVDPDCLKEEGKLFSPAVYYKSCSICGEKSTETFTHSAISTIFQTWLFLRIMKLVLLLINKHMIISPLKVFL